MIYRFLGFELDAEGFLLRRGGEPVDIQPKTLDLLLYLVRNRHRVVTRRELLEALWPGSVVTPNALTRIVSQARAALGDTAAQPRMIRTVPRRGYRFVAPVESVPREAGGSGVPGSTPFVGRAEVLRTLRAELDRALAGSTRLVVLSGEPGIGKSRLLQELAAEARRRGAQVLTGHGYEGEGAPPYWPWTQILRAFLRTRTKAELRADLGSGAAAVAQVAPDLAAALPDLPAPRPLEPGAARFRLWDAVATTAARSAARAPLLLAFEDVHGADRSSLRLLEFLLREVSDAPLLVVATHPPERVGPQHPFAEMLERLARRVSLRRVTLEGLSEEEVAAFVEARTGARPGSERTRALERRTGGNPLFLEALTAPEEGAAAGARADPPALGDAVRSRVRAVGPATRECLALASVLGTEFERDALIRSSELPADEVLRGLEEAEWSGLVRRIPGEPGRLRFAHGLIQETLYADAGVAERVRRHWSVGRALEAAGPEAYSPVEIAHHLCEGAPAGDPDRAIRHALRAAEEASSNLAFDEAVQLHRRAIDVLGLKREVEGGERAELLLALGRAEQHAGRSAEAAATFEAAASLARRMGSPRILARAALGAAPADEPAGAYARSESVPRLEEALERLGAADPAMRSRLLARLARFLGARGETERAGACAEEAASLARSAGDDEAAAEALDAWNGAVEGLPERAEERLARSAEVLRRAESLPDPALSVTAHLRRAAAFLERGRLGELRAELDAAGTHVGDARASSAAWRLAVARALLALLEGDLREAGRRMEAAREAGRAIRHPGADLAFAVQRVQLRYHQGRLGELTGELGHLESRFASLPSLRAARAWALCEAGEAEAARSAFEALAERGFARVPRLPPRIGVLAVLAVVCHHLGDARRAEALYGLLEPYRDCVVQVGLTVCGGSVARYLALLASAAGRPELAVREAQRAVAANAALGAPLWEARARDDLERLHEGLAGGRGGLRRARGAGPAGDAEDDPSSARASA